MAWCKFLSCDLYVIKENIGIIIHAGEQRWNSKDPESFSDYYNEEIIQSISFYNQKEYQKAIDVLKIAF